MKKIILLLSVLLISYSSAFAQLGNNFVRYISHSSDYNKSFVDLYVSYKEGVPNIIVSTTCASDFFDEEPVMMMRLSNDEVIRLEGKTLLTTSYTDEGDDSGYKSSAIFPITDDIVEKLNEGVFKIRLYTIPAYQEESFNKDRVGKRLYKLFQDRKKKESEF